MCHVLIIEDEWLLADHMAQLVTEAGATSIDMASTEEDAVALAAATAPAVIISDVNLRMGSGPVAVWRITETLGDAGVMFVTGTPEACRPCRPAAIVLNKPVADETLVSTFRMLAPL